MKTLYSILTVIIIAFLGLSINDRKNKVRYDHKDFEEVSKKLKKTHDSIITVKHERHGE